MTPRDRRFLRVLAGGLLLVPALYLAAAPTTLLLGLTGGLVAAILVITLDRLHGSQARATENRASSLEQGNSLTAADKASASVHPSEPVVEPNLRKADARRAKAHDEEWTARGRPKK